MNRFLYCIIAIILVVVVASCNDDDTATIPSYRTDLLCAITDADSMVTHLLLDEGTKFQVPQRIKAPQANATVRCRASFAVDAEGTSVKVYDISSVTSFVPLPVDSFKTFPREPLNMVSVWKSPGYINLCFAPLVNKDVKCKYAFCIDSITSRTLHVSMLFEKKGDAPDAYSTKLYHSIPLTSPDYKQDFDSLSLHINTYDGLKTYIFPR